MFRGLNQRKKGEKKYPSAYKKSFCISLSLPPRVKAKVLRHSTVGQNNILCSAHHIPIQAKCLWIFFFSNFKAFWLKYTRRALTEQAVFCSSAEGFNGLRRCSKSIYFKAGMKQTWQMAFKKKKSKGKFLEHILQNKILFLFFFFRAAEMIFQNIWWAILILQLSPPWSKPIHLETSVLLFYFCECLSLTRHNVWKRQYAKWMDPSYIWLHEGCWSTLQILTGEQNA